jgi:carbon-monoxide dehydrogenase catalytic subunit
MEYIEINEEDALNIAKEIVKKGVENFVNRKKELIKIPTETKDLIAGFTTEYVHYMLGGKYRSTYRPLNDAIRDGRIRGVAGLVGCNNPKLMSGQSHVILAKELIKKDVLVVETGCAAIECAKAGLLTPEAAFEYAGRGLREVCEAFGTPFPVTGSKNVLKFCTEEVEKITGGKWVFEPDPYKAAQVMIEHIDKKRQQLNLKPMMYE